MYRIVEKKIGSSGISYYNLQRKILFFWFTVSSYNSSIDQIKKEIRDKEREKYEFPVKCYANLEDLLNDNDDKLPEN